MRRARGRRRSGRSVLVFEARGDLGHERCIRPGVESVEGIERGPADLGISILEQRAQRFTELLLRCVIGHKGSQRNGRSSADRVLGILDQGEKFWQQRAAEFSSQLAHHKSYPDPDVRVWVGKCGASATDASSSMPQDPNGDRQRLHERGAHGGRGLGKNIAHLVREIAQRVAGSGERLEGFVAHEVGIVEQRIGDEQDVGLYRAGPASRRGDGGGTHNGVGIFCLLGDQPRFAPAPLCRPFRARAAQAALISIVPVRICFTSGAMEASTAALFFPMSSMIAALISGGSF